jgi:hypothetical protein
MLHLYLQGQDFHLLLLLCIDHIFHWTNSFFVSTSTTCGFTNTTLFIKYFTSFFIKDYICRKSAKSLRMFYFFLLLITVIIFSSSCIHVWCHWAVYRSLCFHPSCHRLIPYYHLCLFHQFPILKHYLLLFFLKVVFLP